MVSEWSDEGKDFLSTTLGKEWDEYDQLLVGGLQPKFFKSYEEVWVDYCKGEDTDLEKQSFYYFTSRGEDTLLVGCARGLVHCVTEVRVNFLGSNLGHGQPQQRQKTHNALQAMSPRQTICSPCNLRH